MPRFNRRDLLVGILLLSVSTMGGGLLLYHAYRQSQAQQAQAGDRRAPPGTAVRTALEEARQLRAELHGMLLRPGGASELVQDTARWEHLVQAARAQAERARSILTIADPGVDPKLRDDVEALLALITRDEAD